jgi:hypothetical protein
MAPGVGVAVFSRHAFGILEHRGALLEELAQRLAPLGRVLSPIGLDRIPDRGEADIIGITILDDDRRHALRLVEREAQPDRRAIVLHVDRELPGADRVSERVDHAIEIVERISELRAVRLRGVAEARVVRRDHVVLVGEQRDQVAEHVAR